MQNACGFSTRAWFLSLDTIDIWRRMILCREGLSCALWGGEPQTWPPPTGCCLKSGHYRNKGRAAARRVLERSRQEKMAAWGRVGGRGVREGWWVWDTCGMWGQFLGSHKPSASPSVCRCPVHVLGLRPWPFSSCESLSPLAQFPHL